MEEYPTRLYFWRTQTGQEVDFLIERGGKLLAFEVKWAHKIDKSDISGLKSCAEALKEKLKFSIILYSGTEVVAFDPNTIAMPFSILLGRD